jgi:ADP-ribose pyrophosphatase YjhB (NUDIX family)
MTLSNSNVNDLSSENMTDESQQTVIAKKFSLRHSFRAGAIVWAKDKRTNRDYYLVFKSYTRPTRGIQLPGGRVEKLENVADTVIREVKEETNVDTRILCPLGFIYLNNPAKNYSRVEIYYIVRPLYPIDIRKRWHHTDKDKSAQKLECWFLPADKAPLFLAGGQDLSVTMFQQWLKEHSKSTEYLQEMNNVNRMGFYSASKTISDNVHSKPTSHTKPVYSPTTSQYHYPDNTNNTSESLNKKRKYPKDNKLERTANQLLYYRNKNTGFNSFNKNPKK